MADRFLQSVLRAAVYDVAEETPLEVADRLSWVFAEGKPESFSFEQFAGTFAAGFHSHISS